MKRLHTFLLAVWEFVVGDDWRTAIGVALTLALTALVAAVGASAWWVMPPAVLGLLALSIRRAMPGGRADLAGGPPRHEDLGQDLGQ
jgi:hypothetical protein